VTPGEGAADTRRRVPLSELSAIEADASAMESAIESYGRHRLLTFDRDPTTREPTVEVAHEALLSAWERLRGWIDQGREDLRMHRRLSEAANEWERSGTEPSFLLTGSRLDQFESWASTTSLALGASERGYLVASIARRETERSAETARGERERRVERRSVKRLRALVAVLTVAALLAGALTVFALNQTAKAGRASRLAAVRELATAAAANLEVDHQLATLLALEALETARSVDLSIDPQVEDVLRRAAPAVAIDATSIVGADIRAVSFASDGTAVAIVGRDGSLGVWDLSNGSRIVAIQATEAPCNNRGCSDVFTAALSADASVLVFGDGEGVAHVWDLGSAREILTVRSASRLPRKPMECPVDRSPYHACPLELGEDTAPFVAVDPEGRLLATSTSDATVRIWDIASGRMTDANICHEGAATRFLCLSGMFLTFSLDGTRLFIEVAEPGFLARVVDVRSGKTLTMQADRLFDAFGSSGSRFAYAAGVNGFAFSPAGEFARFRGSDVWLLAAGVRPWDVSAGDPLLPGHTRQIDSASFSPDGTRLATGSLDGTARVWNTSTGDLIYISPVEQSDVAAVAFSRDGSRVTTVYSDGRIIVHPIALRDAIEIAQARLTRGLTDEECLRYLHVPECPAD
jgi:WD40 repeat protein